MCGRGLVLALCGRGFMLAPRVGVALCFRCVVLRALDSSPAGGAPWNYCQNAVFCRSYLTGFTVCEKGLEQRLFWDAAWTPQARSWPLALRRCSCARYLLPLIPAWPLLCAMSSPVHWLSAFALPTNSPALGHRHVRLSNMDSGGPSLYLFLLSHTSLPHKFGPH